MLLLVLILVLSAFGLLVAALLSGSVMWAWVSVGVSIAAACVLLIDWLQRRAAIKAGTRSALESSGPRYPAPAPAREPEPVTEVLPVIPPAVPVPGESSSVGAAAMGPEGGAVESPTTVDTRFDQASDAQQTIIMPVVQPSSSSARPSGAEGGTTASSGQSSPSVVKSGSGVAPVTPGSGDSVESAAGAPGAAPDASPTVLTKVQGGKAVAGDAPDSTAQVDRAAPDVEARSGAAGSADAEATMMVDVAQTGGAAGHEAGEQPEGTQPVPPEPEIDSDAEPTRMTPISAGAGQANLFDGRPADSTAAGSTAAVPAEAATAADEAGEQLPAGPDGEPPEEPRDPAAAALVAGLGDEVIVVDEQPRYHVLSCRSLVGVATIPLPAHEAVELGFTPCGWCGPDRTLASRHSARAQ